MKIDAENLGYKELNEALREASGDAEVRGCLGQRFICAGMSGRTVRIDGVPGNALGAYLNGAEIVVEGNAQDAVVTPAMINNYVKLKIIPPPVKKRYSREHLAYLIMVCVLKQSMNTGNIRLLLPATLPAEDVKRLYADFVETVKKIQGKFCRTLREAAAPALEKDGPPVTHLIFQTAVAANLFRQAAEGLISLRKEEEKPEK